MQAGSHQVSKVKVCQYLLDRLGSGGVGISGSTVLYAPVGRREVKRRLPDLACRTRPTIVQILQWGHRTLVRFASSSFGFDSKIGRVNYPQSGPCRPKQRPCSAKAEETRGGPALHLRGMSDHSRFGQRRRTRFRGGGTER
jgi:hypothetical protein